MAKRLIKYILYIAVVAGLIYLALHIKTLFPFLNSDSAKIIHIIDGDSILVLQNNEVHEIRMLGFDAPELAMAHSAQDCYASESIEKIQQISEKNSKVTIKKDNQAGDTDKYGRELRYVILQDGTDLAQLLIRQGYGKQMTVQQYAKQQDYINAQKEAEVDDLGLWSESNCPQIRPI